MLIYNQKRRKAKYKKGRMIIMKCRQFHSKNQFLLEGEGKTIFQSYQTIIAKVEGGAVTIDTSAEEYSKTTSKYLYKFLNEYSAENISNKKDLLVAVKEGRIKREDLNK